MSLLLLKERQVVPISSLLELLFWDEVESSRINAVSLSCGCWTIGEHVADVGIGKRASEFCALYIQGIIFLFNDTPVFDSLKEAGPAGARIVFVGGAKEWLPGDDINVDSFFFVVPVCVFEWRFRAIFLCYCILKGRETFFEFAVRWLRVAIVGHGCVRCIVSHSASREEEKSAEKEAHRESIPHGIDHAVILLTVS